MDELTLGSPMEEEDDDEEAEEEEGGGGKFGHPSAFFVTEVRCR